MRSCFDSLAFLRSSAAPFVLLAALLTGCASTPVEPSPCTVDVATHTLQCSAVRDSAALIDEESILELTVTLEAAAFDGTTRSFDASVDYVTVGASGVTVEYDSALLTGLEAGPAHDTSIESTLLSNRVHLLEAVGYDRVEVSGEVAIDAAGHGHIDISWTDPASARSSAGSLSAEF